MNKIVRIFILKLVQKSFNFLSKLILEVLIIILVAVHDFESEVMKGIYETLEVTYFS